MNAVNEQPANGPENPANDASRQWVLVMALAVLVTGALVFMFLGFARYGEDFIRRRDDSVGDMLMREGKRQEASYEYALALATYERALKARFNGPENRTYTLERAGVLLWKEGRFEEGADHLTRALAGPGATVAPYEGLVDSLLRLNRLDEAQDFIGRWLEAATTVEEEGKACHAEARLAEVRGDVNGAMEIYERCVERYAVALSAGRLGELLAEKGEREKAVSYLERYFLLGAPEGENAALQDLYARILEETAAK